MRRLLFSKLFSPVTRSWIKQASKIFRLKFFTHRMTDRILIYKVGWIDFPGVNEASDKKVPLLKIVTLLNPPNFLLPNFFIQQLAEWTNRRTESSFLR